MHDMDKPQASAIGKLVRSSKRKLVNPFPAGIALWKKAHALGVHFSYSHLLATLHQLCAQVKCVKIKVQLDLNDTRVAAQHGLFLSDIEMSRDEWKDLIVQETVLNTM
jgi:hypothetical protein